MNTDYVYMCISLFLPSVTSQVFPPKEQQHRKKLSWASEHKPAAFLGQRRRERDNQLSETSHEALQVCFRISSSFLVSLLYTNFLSFLIFYFLSPLISLSPYMERAPRTSVEGKNVADKMDRQIENRNLD